MTTWGRLGAVLAIVAGSWTAAAATPITAQATLSVSTVTTVAYAVLAGVKKFQDDLQRGWTRLEFYVALLQVAAVIGASLLDSHAVPARDAALVTAAVSAAYALSRSLAKPPAGRSAPEPLGQRAPSVPLV